MAQHVTMRRWTKKENRVLKEYINSHLGNADGLSGDYWDRLSEVLNCVREEDDTVLGKVQVRNKINNLRKKGFSSSDVLQYGTNVDTTNGVKALEKHSKSKASTEQPASVGGTAFLSDDFGHRVLNQTDAEAASITETIALDSTVDSDSNAPRYDHKSISNQNTPLQPWRTDTAQHRTWPHTKQNSSDDFKRSRSDDSCSVSTNGRTKTQRRKTRRLLAQGKQDAREAESKRAASETLTRSSDCCNEQHSLCVNNQTKEARVEVVHSSQVRAENGIAAIIWQDQIFQAWQGYLACQNRVLIAPQEPMHHRNILFTIEDISKHIHEASKSMQEMFPCPRDFGGLGASGAQILSVLTGSRALSEAEDALKIGQTLEPLSDRINLISVVIGATIHRWIFEGFRLLTPRLYDRDVIRTLLDEFIERDCPKLWTSYQNLYQHQYLSSYDDRQIDNDAEKYANDAYALLSAAYSRKGTSNITSTDKFAFSAAFLTQEQYYQTFKNNMIEAYRLALELRVSLAKCSDLTYEFQFPKMRNKFDPTCMEGRKSSGDHDTIVSGGQCIAACFLPSIWSRARGENDYGKPSTLVTKAIVLL